MDSAVCRTVSSQRRTPISVISFAGRTHLQRWVDRGLSGTGMAGGHLWSEADDMALLRGCADTLVVLLSARPRHARTTCHGRGKRLFHQWPIRLDDDLSPRAVPDAGTWIGNIVCF